MALIKLMGEMILSLQVKMEDIHKVMEAGPHGHWRNRPACKDKWAVIFGDFKRIIDN